MNTKPEKYGFNFMINLKPAVSVELYYIGLRHLCQCVHLIRISKQMLNNRNTFVYNVVQFKLHHNLQPPK